MMSGRIKPIKNDADYEEALNLVEVLIEEDPQPDTELADQLSVLSTLIADYENRNFPIDIPSAVDAIKFRMDQMGLKPVDLVPYIGSASRVSEILSGKRSLTVSMINDLAIGLGIPEKALLKKNDNENEYSRSIPTPMFKQMQSRGYFSDIGTKASLLESFFNKSPVKPAILLRRSKFRTKPDTNHYALIAWAGRVIEKANALVSDTEYNNTTVTLEYMKGLVKYSADNNSGVQNVINHLLNDGIKVVIEPALQGTRLDGAVIFEDKKHPIIGLTLRYDRLDNFWFTLMHELAHISLHHGNANQTIIYDDLEIKSDDVSDLETEADSLASEALVDTSKWLVSAARMIPSPLAASSLASELGVHIAIIAGKARYESGNWKYLSSTVNKYTIRDKFKEVTW